MFFILGLIIAVLGLLGWRLTRERVPRFVLGSVGVVFLCIALLQVITVIPAGHVGVVDFFGVVSPTTLKAGINMVNPLARIIKFSVKTQEMKESMDVPSKEGLTVQIEVSVLFHLHPDQAAEVYKTIGETYLQIILEPQFRSVARGVTASFDAKALYTAERETLARTILKELQMAVASRGIAVEATPLRRVGLPKGLTAAIEDKLRAEQESQRMQFILQREQQEAQRKRIEAQGIADFQSIVTKGISDQLLQWKGIEATEKLAASANSKVVIIGGGKTGLPLILNTN